MKVFDENNLILKKGDRLKIEQEVTRFQSFANFREVGISNRLLFVWNICFTFLYCPYFFVSEGNFSKSPFDQETTTLHTLFLIKFIVLVLTCISSWLVYFNLPTTHSVVRLDNSYRVSLSIFLLFLTCFCSLNFLSSIIYYKDIDESNQYPSDRLMLLVLIPLSAAMIFRETIPHSNNLLMLLIYAIGSLVIALDRRAFHEAVFSCHRKLEDQIEEITKSALERKVKEMRDIIGSVAHDLKTPLSSFITATELIYQDIHDCQDTIQSLQTSKPVPGLLKTLPFSTQYENEDEEYQNHSSASIEVYEIKQRLTSSFHNISLSLDAIRDIHTFMLMMINRGIDYKKASTGIALIPQIESMTTSAVINMPVQCIRHFQQKIAITFEIASDIHATIRTDQQWLQENLLCLLSNAVKHSRKGPVELMVTLVSPASQILQQKVPGRIQDEIKVEASKEERHSRTLRSIKRPAHRLSIDSISSFFPRILRNSISSHSEEGRNPSSPPKHLPHHRSVVKVVPSHPITSEPIQRTLNTTMIDCGNDDSLPQTNKQLQSSQFLLFEVKDRSNGLSPIEMQNFFNPFKQQRLSGGMGLGLYSLAKRIEALGGQYGVHRRSEGKERRGSEDQREARDGNKAEEEEEEETGSVVWFTIPYEPDYSQSRTQQQKKERLRREDLLREKFLSHSPQLSPRLVRTGSRLPPPRKIIETPASAVMDEITTSAIDLSANTRYTVGGKKKPKRRVLVVDDSPTITKLICQMLERQEIETEIAENGAIAVEKVIQSYHFVEGKKETAVTSNSSSSTSNNDNNNDQEETLRSERRSTYTAILMDYQMPVMDGVMATQKIREYEKQAGIPVTNRLCIVGISAMSDHEMIEAGKQQGMNTFLSKPFSGSDFMTFVEAYHSPDRNMKCTTEQNSSSWKCSSFEE